MTQLSSMAFVIEDLLQHTARCPVIIALGPREMDSVLRRQCDKVHATPSDHLHEVTARPARRPSLERASPLPTVA